MGWQPLIVHSSGKESAMTCCWKAIAVVMLAHSAAVALADNPPALLPGEQPITLGRPLVGASRLPTLQEIEQSVRQAEVRPLVLFRLHGDRHNHYAPAWSADGRSLVCLRADIDERTCKVLIYPALSQEQPAALYDESLTYEHMPAWSSGSRSLLAFSSNRGDDREENIHVWEPGAEPRAVTNGPGSKVLPQLLTDSGVPQLLFRRVNEFELLTIQAAGPAASPRSLGSADEMRLSPNGDSVAVISAVDVQSRGQMLSVRNLTTQRNLRLISEPGRLLRNPVWSPDGRWIALWSRGTDSLEWELWSAGADGQSAPRKLRDGVRVQEDFRHVGPAWSPDARRIWFTLSRGDQSYYPLHWTSPDGSAQAHLDYDRSLTTTLDLTCCPHPEAAALSFVAVAERSLDVYVMLLNHP